MPKIALILILLLPITSVSLATPPKEDIIFFAEVVDVTFKSRFQGKVRSLAFDSRFVVKLKLLHDVRRIGKAGETIAFAIHSPIRDLLIHYDGSDNGIVIPLKLTSGKTRPLHRLYGKSLEGKLLSSKSVSKQKTQSISYRYDGTHLHLTHHGGTLNAGASGTKAEFLQDGDTLILSVKDKYPQHGPADSLSVADVSYQIPLKKTGSYTVLLNDTATEGGGTTTSHSIVVTAPISK